MKCQARRTLATSGEGVCTRGRGFRRLAFAVAQLLVCVALVGARAQPRQAPDSKATVHLTRSDHALLEDISHRAFLFFWEHQDPKTGLVADRARADGPALKSHNVVVASIASTGFGLTALCIGANRHWVSRADALERVRTALHFFASRAYQQHGWFYHWMDAATGERAWNSEVSSIDSAFLLAGILTARQYFHDDPEIVRLATRIYNRVDFPWMLNGSPNILSMGWKPGTGFLRARWDTYVEETILYLLGIGSPAHPLLPASWYAFSRPRIAYAGYTYIAGARPLFIHQYSHAWVDYRGRRDRMGTDYFNNSIYATRAQRAFCINLSPKFPSYSADVWGITASDSAKGYVAWGGPPADPRIDGTVVPSGPAGSLMFTPQISIAALRTMRVRYGRQIYKRYGFVDAFNPLTRWIDQDVISIDMGITLLSAENLRSGSVWRWFMRNPEPGHAMQLVGFN
jgi:hypothetical protein